MLALWIVLHRVSLVWVLRYEPMDCRVVGLRKGRICVRADMAIRIVWDILSSLG